MYDDGYDERLQRMEWTATLALAKESVRTSGTAALLLVLPLITINLARVLFALMETLALRGTSQLAAVLILAAVAAWAGYRCGHDRARDRGSDATRFQQRPPLRQTAKGVLRRVPLTTLSTLGIAQFVPWPVAGSAGAVLLVADVALVRLNINRMQRLRRLSRFLDPRG